MITSTTKMTNRAHSFTGASFSRSLPRHRILVVTTMLKLACLLQPARSITPNLGDRIRAEVDPYSCNGLDFKNKRISGTVKKIENSMALVQYTDSENDEVWVGFNRTKEIIKPAAPAAALGGGAAPQAHQHPAATQPHRPSGGTPTPPTIPPPKVPVRPNKINPNATFTLDFGDEPERPNNGNVTPVTMTPPKPQPNRPSTANATTPSAPTEIQVGDAVLLKVDAAKPGKKTALIITISYPGSSSALPGCIEDGRRMYNNLKERGFSVTWMRDDHWERKRQRRYTKLECDACKLQVRAINEEGVCERCYRKKFRKPTKSNIENELQNLAKNTSKGDVNWLQYSGHGTQSRDRTGSEDDGMDEAIVPCDYKRGRYIEDDWFRMEFTEKLPQGSETVIIFDCCHSGSLIDLPYQYERGQWDLDPSRQPNTDDAFVLYLSGCKD